MAIFIKEATITNQFIKSDFLKEGQNQYTLRESFIKCLSRFRQLKLSEKEELKEYNNKAENWDLIFVTDKFDPKKVRNCRFYGLIRIGDLEDGCLEHHDLRLSVGLYNSKIISCDFGDNVCVENVSYISHYQIGDESLLFDINEISTSSHAKFGNGILKVGEEEKLRIWLEICNENGGRSVLPFDGMLSGDAYLWSKYRDDQTLMNKFLSFTQERYGSDRGHYGVIGRGSTIKHCRILKDVKIGEYAYIKGVNKLKNLTINSSSDCKTQIGEGVELVNGIIGYGCNVFYGVKAVRFLLGNNSSLKYGARLINSFLGENSTISCCEVLNALIFPGHEQHHNNSFLCAATVQGQSNIASAATIGSNHNSRANDGEIVAKRGFWPGLAVSLKHNSKFASFTLLSKGSYPSELNITIPFSLIINDEANGRLKIFPGFWFLYNMYALARNSWKYKKRDKRRYKVQLIEFDYLAPDVIDETLKGLKLLEEWVGNSIKDKNEDNTVDKGREALCSENFDKNIEVFASNVESSKRPVQIVKPFEGYKVLGEVVLLYATKILSDYCIEQELSNWDDIKNTLQTEKKSGWQNIGGQLIRSEDVDKLKNDICTGIIISWSEVHERYKQLGKQYPLHKAQHAYFVLKMFWTSKNEELNKIRFINSLEQGVEINAAMVLRTFNSRKKDYECAYRKMVYDSTEEMNAVVGDINDNEFIKQTYYENDKLKKTVFELVKVLG
jgi:hypothetical protein